MSEMVRLKGVFELALRSLLNNWRVWCGDDEIRALHIGFDSYNTEVSINLLTDREPYLEKQQLDPFGDRWPTADWRLTCINQTGNHGFPDAAELLAWMERQSKELNTDDLEVFNRSLKTMFFEVATAPVIQRELERFARFRQPFRIRVEWYFDREPYDATITTLTPVRTSVA